jgi:hypothetical protein
MKGIIVKKSSAEVIDYVVFGKTLDSGNAQVIE